MKKEWNTPTLEVLNVKDTYSVSALGKGRGDSDSDSDSDSHGS